MEDFKVAVTGGPKGGKSDFLKVIKRNLHRGRERGKFKCITVPETARELMQNIAKPEEVDQVVYQEKVFKRQIFKENEAKDFSDDLGVTPKRVVTICDRGVMDNKAYLDDEENFKEYVKHDGLSEIELLDDYNLVLYLASSSTLDDGTYDAGYDDIRDESKEEAIELGEKTIRAWLGHRNIVIIPAEKDFNVKMSKAVLTVKQQLKFGRWPNERIDITDYDTSAYETGEFPTIMETTYNFPKLIMADYLNGVVKRTYNGHSSYILFTKRDTGPKRGYVIEKEEPITEREFKRKLKERGCYPGPINQEVTYVYEDNTIYKIIKEGDNKYLEIMTGEKKLPKLLDFQDKKSDLSDVKIKTKSFKNR